MTYREPMQPPRDAVGGPILRGDWVVSEGQSGLLRRRRYVRAQSRDGNVSSWRYDDLSGLRCMRDGMRVTDLPPAVVDAMMTLYKGFVR